MNAARDYECWTCLDFGYLPEIGPCPDCCPDAYAERLAAWLDHQEQGMDAA
ncbi:MAG: hypothetical protein ACRDP9_01430 [Kribbellaceae bacterium]